MYTAYALTGHRRENLPLGRARRLEQQACQTQLLPENGSFAEARFNFSSFVSVVCFDQCNLLVTDTYNRRIRLIDFQTETVRTIATKTLFTFPAGVVCLSDGTVFVCDYSWNCIRCINSKTNLVTTLAGSLKEGHADGIGEDAQFNSPCKLVHRDGFLYVSDEANQCIRCINIKTRAVTTIAGIPKKKGFQDGAANEAMFDQPQGLAFDTDGNLLVCDFNNWRIRRIDLKKKLVRTVAGNGEYKTVDGSALQASFEQPISIVSDSMGNLIISERYNGLRRLDARTGYVSTVTHVDGCYLYIHCCDEFDRLYGIQMDRIVCVRSEQSVQLYVNKALTSLISVLPSGILRMIANYSL